MADTLTVGLAEAHNRLSELIDMVQNGRAVAISRGGTVAVHLTLPEESPRKGNGPQIAALLEEMIRERGNSGRSTADIEEGMRIEHAAWD